MVTALACADDSSDGTDAGGDGDDGAGPPDEDELPDLPQVDLIPIVQGNGVLAPAPNEVAWSSPWSLGTALVHDARSAVSLPDEVGGLTLLVDDPAGAQWQSVAGTEQAQLRHVGFRTQSLDARLGLAFADDGSLRGSLRDDSVYLADYDANYRVETSTYLYSSLASERSADLAPQPPDTQAGWRPLLVHSDTPILAGGDTSGVEASLSVTWVLDAGVGGFIAEEYQLIRGATASELDDTLATAQGLGTHWPISISARGTDETGPQASLGRYAAVLAPQPTPAVPWRAQLNLRGADAMQQYVLSEWNAQRYPYAIEAHAEYDDTPGGEVIPVYSVLTAALPPLVSVQATAHLSTAELRALDITRRTQGYHLVSSAGVGEDYTAVWIRALPYLRFQGTPCTSTQCQSLALPFAQLVPPLLQLTPGKVGQFTRPSGTIAVLKDGAVLLERGYTFAPAYYPDTRVDDAFTWASASKSLTGALVADLMGEQGHSLDTPFIDAIGWSADPVFMAGIPAGLENVTVRQMLQMRGGWPTPSEYWNAEELRKDLVDAGITVAHPLSGADFGTWIRLAVSGGVMTMEPLWEQSSVGVVDYSNLSTSLLGELAVVLAGGSSFGEVLVTRYSSQPGVAGLRPTPDLRYDPPRSRILLTALRAHLTDTQHPYRFDTRSEFYVDPIEGAQALPVFDPADDKIVLIRDNVVPAPHTPIRAHILTYGGRLGLGTYPLAAGGWAASATNFARVIRGFAEGESAPLSRLAPLWDPSNAAYEDSPAWSATLSGMAYNGQWYLRGNWVAALGGTGGAITAVLHNREYDLTVAVAANVTGSIVSEYVTQVFSDASLMSQLPCVDEALTAADECNFNGIALP